MILFVLFVLNFGISWLNAWGCGRTWEESKAAGGFAHFVTWCAAIMSASGFTWCYTIVLAFLAGSFPYHGHVLLAPKYVRAALELGYVIVILPVIGSGLAITISSWRDFARERSLRTGGVAAYNSFAQIYNTYEAIRVLPGVLHDLSEVFSSKDNDSDSNGGVLAIALVLLAVLGGVLTTTAIIRHTAKVHRLQVRAELLITKAAKRA